MGEHESLSAAEAAAATAARRDRPPLAEFVCCCWRRRQLAGMHADRRLLPGTPRASRGGDHVIRSGLPSLDGVLARFFAFWRVKKCATAVEERGAGGSKARNPNPLAPNANCGAHHRKRALAVGKWRREVKQLSGSEQPSPRSTPSQLKLTTVVHAQALAAGALQHHFRSSLQSSLSRLIGGREGSDEWSIS